MVLDLFIEVFIAYGFLTRAVCSFGLFFDFVFSSFFIELNGRYDVIFMY